MIVFFIYKSTDDSFKLKDGLFDQKKVKNSKNSKKKPKKTPIESSHLRCIWNLNV